MVMASEASQASWIFEILFQGKGCNCVYIPQHLESWPRVKCAKFYSHSCFKLSKNTSTTALFKQAPTLLIEDINPTSLFRLFNETPIKTLIGINRIGIC